MFCFCLINENKDLSYPGTGILQGPGTVSLKGIGGHFMKEIFVCFLACFEIGFQVRLQLHLIRYNLIHNCLYYNDITDVHAFGYKWSKKFVDSTFKTRP